MTDANREQIEIWNSVFGPRWVAHQERLDRVWGPLGDATIERAAVLPGEQVLDVGCGCGATALQLAAKVGPAGAVVGVDVSAPMLAPAKERTQALGVANVRFVNADASTYALDDAVDLVFSRAGIMFFGDPTSAFTNLRRALRPGGRLAFVCFRDQRQNPCWTVPLAAAATVAKLEPPAAPKGPGVFSLADEDRLRAVVEQSGFVDLIPSISISRSATTLSSQRNLRPRRRLGASTTSFVRAVASPSARRCRATPARTE